MTTALNVIFRRKVFRTLRGAARTLRRSWRLLDMIPYIVPEFLLFFVPEAREKNFLNIRLIKIKTKCLVYQAFRIQHCNIIIDIFQVRAFLKPSKDHEKLIRSIFEPYKAAELYICRNISGKRPDEKQTKSDRLQDISEVLPAEAVRKSWLPFQAPCPDSLWETVFHD